MDFRIDDLVIMNECGIEKFFGNSEPGKKIMRVAIFRVSSPMNGQNIYLESLNEGKIPNNFPAIYFRLATKSDLEAHKIKNIFNKRSKYEI